MKGGRTIEQRVGNEAAWINDSAVAIRRKGLTIIEILCSDSRSLQLLRVKTLDVASVILEEVGKFVVDENRGLEVGDDFKVDDTLALLRDIRVG